jgi:hypothetical protein
VFVSRLFLKKKNKVFKAKKMVLGKAQKIALITLSVLTVVIIIVVVTVVCLQKKKRDDEVKLLNNIQMNIYNTNFHSPGRFGNQCFQVGSLIGLSQSLNKKIKIDWPMGNLLFEPIDECNFRAVVEVDPKNTVVFEEKNPFAFENIKCDKNVNLDIHGYRQNCAYFNHVVYDLRRAFTFRKKLVDAVYVKLPCLNSLKNTCIGVHIRREDFVDNPLHEVCNSTYYLFGINFFRSMYPNAPIVLISDDKKWCSEFIASNLAISDIFVSPFTTAWEDFICLSLCGQKVLSNSTFGWWAAWIDMRVTSHVLAPSPWILQSFENKWKELYDPQWFIFDTKQNMLIQVPTKLPMNIGAFYQCYKQPHAFYNVCKAFRCIYPDSSLIVINDAGDDLSKIASYFNANSYKSNPSRNGDGITTNMHQMQQIITFLFNFVDAARQMNETWFILLEDDVCCQRALQLPSENVNADVVGNNLMCCKFNDGTMDLLQKNGIQWTSKYYGGNGGSLFRTSFWAKLDKVKIVEQLITFSTKNDTFHTDIVIAFLCLMNHGRLICGPTEFPSEFSETKFSLGTNTTPAILHQMKQWYNKPLTLHEQANFVGTLKI